MSNAIAIKKKALRCANGKTLLKTSGRPKSLMLANHLYAGSNKMIPE